MKVYLDNNVLVDIEDGRYSLSDFLLVQNIEYYYSDAHLSELLEAVDNPRVSQEGRLELISEICGDNNILTGVFGPPEIFHKYPAEMYKFVDTPLRRSINKIVSNGGDVFDRVRHLLGFDSKNFNNEKPEEVLRILDNRMSEKLQIGLLQYLSDSEAFPGKPLFCTLLNVLDAANYWGDTKTNHSDIARLNDASHAYYAQICDVLVTNDKRMIAKVKAIYSFLGINNKVLSVKEFLKTIGGHNIKI